MSCSAVDHNIEWCLQGSADEKEQAALELLEVLEAVRVVAVLLSPITPALSRIIYQQLGYTDADFQAVSWADTQWGGESSKLVCSELLLMLCWSSCHVCQAESCFAAVSGLTAEG